MATKGTQFSRTMRYFQDADIHEAVAALKAATDIVGQRHKVDRQPGPRKQRARKSNAADTAASQESLANA